MITEAPNGIVELRKNEDSRGFLVEFLSAEELPAGMDKFRQIYVATMKPGAVRGNHYHKNKLEWVGAITGRIRMILEDVETEDRKEIILDGDGKTMRRVLVNARIAHTYENVSDREAVLIVYTNEVYEPGHTDTYEHKLL